MRAIPTVFIITDDPVRAAVLHRYVTASDMHGRIFPDVSTYAGTRVEHVSGCVIIESLAMKSGRGGSSRGGVAEAFLHPAIVIVSDGDVATAVSAMKRGVVDVMQESFEDGELRVSIEQALRIDARTRRDRERSNRIKLRLQDLTPREKQVLRLLLAGKKNREAAKGLRIGQKTVEAHRSSIMRKMGAHTPLDLYRLVQGIRAGSFKTTMLSFHNDAPCATINCPLQIDVIHPPGFTDPPLGLDEAGRSPDDDGLAPGRSPVDDGLATGDGFPPTDED